MSQENVETVRRMLVAWTAGRFDDALTYFDRDVVWDVQNRPDGGIYHGMDEVQDGLRTWLGTWTNYVATFDEYIDVGDHVLVVGTERGTAKASGIEVNRPSAIVYTLRGGKIVLAKNYTEKSEALEAIGQDG